VFSKLALSRVQATAWRGICARVNLALRVPQDGGFHPPYVSA
jgi:hypothetical protein